MTISLGHFQSLLRSGCSSFPKVSIVHGVVVKQSDHVYDSGRSTLIPNPSPESLILANLDDEIICLGQ